MTMAENSNVLELDLNSLFNSPFSLCLVVLHVIGTTMNLSLTLTARVTPNV